MKPWHLLIAGALAGILAMWFLTPRPGPDHAALEAAQAEVAQAHEKSHRDSLTIAAKDDTLRASHAHTDSVATAASVAIAAAATVASTEAKKAHVAQVALRAVLDSLGASTATLDAYVGATDRVIEAKDTIIASVNAENDALRAENAILWRRTDASDTLISSLRVELDRQQAVDVERATIQKKLQGAVRGAKIRERVAEVVAISAITWKVVG